MSFRFEIFDTSLDRVKLIQRKPISDHRGYLERLFCEEELKSLLGDKGIAQINRSLTRNSGVVRGMHFQYPPHAETKIVSCLRGEVFDVAVDLRPGSTFLHWHAEILSATNHKTLLIPEGFAHGFQSLTKDCELLYLHTAGWNPGSEGGLHPQDSTLNIRWPHPVTEISARDESHPVVSSSFAGVLI